MVDTFVRTASACRSKACAWRASGVVDQRKRFVREYESGEWTMAELCRIYEVSRESGYKWLKRSQVRRGGGAGRSQPSTATSSQSDGNRSIEQQILPLRRQHATWGARKLLVTVTAAQQPRAGLAGGQHRSGELLKREGLTVPRRRATQDAALYATVSGHAVEAESSYGVLISRDGSGRWISNASIL